MDPMQRMDLMMMKKKLRVKKNLRKGKEATTTLLLN